MRNSVLISLALLLTLSSVAQAQTYQGIVPDYVLTPDVVETESIGTLEFFDGMPSTETVNKVYDYIDLSRGVAAFLNGIPAASMYGMLRGFAESGMKPGEIGIFQELMDARSLFLTPNTTTMYVLGHLDLSGV